MKIRLGQATAVFVIFEVGFCLGAYCHSHVVRRRLETVKPLLGNALNSVWQELIDGELKPGEDLTKRLNDEMEFIKIAMR